MRMFYRRVVLGVIVLAGVLVGAATTAWAQEASVSGRVINESGQPIGTARVAIIGTVLVTHTNADGRYTLRGVPTGPINLRVNVIGYAATTRQVTVTAGQPVTVDVALVLLSYSLDQIVVTATGEQQLREVGNAISTVRVDSLIQNAPIANMNDLLGARVAGVEVLPGALTGAGARVRIRGTNSLSLNNEPVYYVDGIRIVSDINSSSIGIGGTNPSRLNDLNPEDIESIDVVKGPSAATLYGTDAANGVVVIRTKRGRAGAPQFSVYTEMGTLRDNNDYPDAYRGWRSSTTDTSAAANSRPRNGTQCILTQVASGACTQDSVTRFNLFRDPQTTPNGTGYRGQVGVQVRGGSDAARYYLSGEYEDEIGYLRMPEFAYPLVTAARQIAEVPYEQYRPNARQRASVKANVQTTLSPRLDLDVSTWFVSSTQRLPQTDNNTTGLLSNALGGPGNEDNGHYGYRLFTPDEMFAEVVNQDINRFIGSATGNWRPTAWLSSRIAGGVDFTSRVDGDLCKRNECTSFGTTKLGFRANNRTTFFEYTLDAQAAAIYRLTSNLQARTTVGLQYFQNLFARNGAFSSDLPPGATTVTSGAIPSVSEVTDESKTLGAYVEHQFAWRQRLFVTGALRGDDNSAFGKDFSAVYYPKLMVSYVISEEPYFPAPSWLGNLRLRGAIGASGTQPGVNDAIRFFSPSAANVDAVNTSAIVFSAVGNPDLRPERARELELGFDASLVRNRVSLNFTYYNKRTKDALIARILAPSVGASITRFENLGAVRNSGIELHVNAQIVNTRPFGWDLTLNAATNHNRIERLGVPPIIGTTIQQREGFPIDGWWQRPYTYTDANGNGIIEATEITVADSAAYIGPSNPTREITLVTGFDLFNRRLRISGLFDHKGGRYQLNGTERIRCESRLNCDGLIDPSASLDRQARVVALRETAARTQYGFMEKANFLRLREFAATYQLPGAWARVMRAQSGSVTLAARNLFINTSYSGIDPESNYVSGATGIQSDFQTAPPPTYWTLRVNLGF